ncbi:hypothetical protein, variant 2 [Verruconis gallopava]|uniref:Uncharacterized protein n=1 Tax=Verruconis gallopava TaxID=253628 RepID=A0A0D1XMG4_9PEZI|nr:hypothetical protein, variant 1 [Verruconis gallopava]XP_016213561.1 hypothetical protein, variant 2 [Verruconis gallopava]KIW03691.1 hypothetical protein, variant 1 [Verruconis gallopava]KIW03692.1 hypothetical protein, variant 2 [Verruconis gallopava]
MFSLMVQDADRAACASTACLDELVRVQQLRAGSEIARPQLVCSRAQSAPSRRSNWSHGHEESDQTSQVLTFNNKETEPVRVQIVGGSLWDIKADTIVRNLTAIPYNVEVPAGSEQSLTYNFATELHPQDLRLYLAALVTKGEMGFQVSAYNGTVSVVEAPLSFFDPQMIFLYVFLSACFAGTCYFIYNTWIATLFPQKKRGGKGGERAKGPSKAGKPVDSSDQAADGPATASGAKVLDESWIPPQHLKKPEAKRTGSGRASTPKSKAR